MLLPVGEDLVLPVDVVDLSGVVIKAHSGTLRRMTAAEYVLEVPEHLAFKTGARVVLNIHALGRRRVAGTVLSAEDGVLRISERRTYLPDQRSFPRLVGGIFLRYRIMHAARAEAHLSRRRWLSAEETPADDTWHAPSPLMNFSVTGLRFDGVPHCAAGDTLICDLGTEPAGPRWRAMARVVRVFPGDPDELAPGATHQICVEFQRIPEPAIEALTTLTLKLQTLAGY